MDSELEQMYQEVILDAAKHPHGKTTFAQDLAASEVADTADTAAAGIAVEHGTSGILRAEHASCITGQSHQFNPTCGDEVTVRVEVSSSEPVTLQAIAWDGHGCSISQASLSFMTDLVEGKTLEEVLALATDFHELMQSRGEQLSEAASEALGDAIVLQGVAKYPMRIKCALLGWEGLKAALAQAVNER